MNDLSEYELGLLQSPMTPGSVGVVLGRSERWVIKAREQLASGKRPRDGNRALFDRAEAKRLYLDELKTPEQIGESFDVSGNAVRKALKKMGVPMRGHSEGTPERRFARNTAARPARSSVAGAAPKQQQTRAPKPPPPPRPSKVDDPELIKQVIALYVEQQLSVYEIEKKLPLSRTTAARMLKEAGIPRRSRGHRPTRESKPSVVTACPKPYDARTVQAIEELAKKAAARLVVGPPSGSGIQELYPVFTPIRHTIPRARPAPKLQIVPKGPPPRWVRFARWFRKAGWTVREVCHLFDRNADELREHGLA